MRWEVSLVESNKVRTSRGSDNDGIYVTILPRTRKPILFPVFLNRVVYVGSVESKCHHSHLKMIAHWPLRFRIQHLLGKVVGKIATVSWPRTGYYSRQRIALAP